MNTDTKIESKKSPWNKGKLVGQKRPLKLKEIWAIRIHLQLDKHIRELALFNLAIDSKLRGCDLVELHVRDIAQGSQVQGSGTWSSQFILPQRGSSEFVAGLVVCKTLRVLFHNGAAIVWLAPSGKWQ